MTTHVIPPPAPKPRPRLLQVTETAMLVATRRAEYDAQRTNVILNGLEQQLRMQRIYLRNHHDFTTAAEQYLAEIEKAARRLEKQRLS